MDPRLAVDPNSLLRPDEQDADEAVRRNESRFHPTHALKPFKHAYNSFNSLMTGNHHWFYSIVKWITAAASAGCVLVAILALAFLVLTDSNDTQAYVVNTFFTEDYSTDTYSWPMLPSSWSGLPNQPPPNGQIFVHYYECLWTVQAGGNLCPTSVYQTVPAYQTCINTNYSSALGQCSVWNSAYQGAWPSPGPYGKCISSAFNFTKPMYDGFSQCIRLDVWPLYQVPQDIDSPFFLGSYNWALITVVSFFIIAAFAAYTANPVDFEEPMLIEYGKGSEAKNRLGLAWIVVPIAMMALITIIAFIVAFRTGAWTQNNPYPTTSSTNTVILTLTTLYLGYFILEWLEFWDERSHGPARASDSSRPRVYQEMQAALFRNPFVGAANTDITTPSIHTGKFDMRTVQYYVPTLMVAWSDALVADAGFLLGFLGSTLQVDTDDSYNVFVLTLVSRLFMCAVSRLVYEAYIKNTAESDAVNKAKGKIPAFSKAQLGPNFHVSNPRDAYHQEWKGMVSQIEYAERGVFSVKVQALSLHFAVVICIATVGYIIFNSNKVYNEYPMLVAMYVVCFLIPESLRFLGHSWISMVKRDDMCIYVALFTQFLWLWDITARMVFLILMFFDNSQVNPGSAPFAATHMKNMTNYIGFFQSYP